MSSLFSKWKACPINGKAKSIFKLVRFEDFSLYWHHNDPTGSCLSPKRNHMDPC